MTGFNSILVQLEANPDFRPTAIGICFNSILVQLEESGGRSATAWAFRFNSILVQLEVLQDPELMQFWTLFQFHIGAIRRGKRLSIL